MTTPPLVTRDALAEVLGAHLLSTYTGGAPTLLGRHACTCGALLPRVPRSDPTLAAAHREHVADALASVVHDPSTLADDDPTDPSETCCCECSPPEFGGNLPDRECPTHGEQADPSWPTTAGTAGSAAV